METIKFKVTGVVPLIMHNGDLANPKNEIVKAMKKITSKRLKTDADHDELARLEFQGSIYMSKEGPCLPQHVVDGVLQYGARKFNEGKIQKMAAWAKDYAVLKYKGPREIKEMWADGQFTHQAMVSVGNSKILRTRVIFKEWSALIHIEYNPTAVNRDRIIEWMIKAGEEVGFCDWRPKFGRFDVEVVSG
jgi:hypothetical protein